jgi:hypothetical protein
MVEAVDTHAAMVISPVGKGAIMLDEIVPVPEKAAFFTPPTRGWGAQTNKQLIDRGALKMFP